MHCVLVACEFDLHCNFDACFAILQRMYVQSGGVWVCAVVNDSILRMHYCFPKSMNNEPYLSVMGKEYNGFDCFLQAEGI